MLYNYCKLRGRIIEKYGTMQKFAMCMGWSERTMSLKMNNKRFWKQPEITKASELLDISSEEIVQYFFN